METQLLTADDAGLARAADILRRGGLVAIPTETVYGLAANALDAEAVARIFAAKQRPFFDPLIVHVASREQADPLARFGPMADALARAFWPGPLTLVLSATAAVPPLVTSGLPTVGLRVPAHPVTLRLLELTGFPLAAPSANLFGTTSPTTATHVMASLGGRIDAVLDGGPCRVGVESTIVACDEVMPDDSVANAAPPGPAGPTASARGAAAPARLRVLRPGGISLEALRAALPGVEVERVASPVVAGQPAPAAPGMLDSHYATATPLRLVDESNAPALASPDLALLAFRRPLAGYATCIVLSREADLQAAAARLFSAMRELDVAGVAEIIAERVPSQGIGLAINDRLQRAATR